MKSLLFIAITAIGLLTASCIFGSSSSASHLSSPEFVDDVILWSTVGNDKFDKPYGDAALFQKKSKVLAKGNAFKTYQKAKALPEGYTITDSFDWRAIDWKTTGSLSISEVQDSGSVIVRISLGGQGLSIYEITKTSEGYSARLIAIS